MLPSRAVMLLALIVAPGCLSGSYNEAHTKSVARYREAGDFQRLHREPKPLAGGRLSVRVPKLFTKENTDKPPLLEDLPGFCCTLQELIDTGNGGEKMPVNLTIWAPVDDAAGLEDVKKRISDTIKAQKDPAFADASWGNVDVPQARPSAWAVMSLQGQQPFERLAAGEQGVRETKSTEGTTKIWVAADPERKVCTVLMWRVPQEAVATVPLEVLAPLVVRTVEMKTVEPPAAAPAAAVAPPPAAAAPPAQ